MSRKHDDSQRTDSSQDISTDNGGIHQSISLHNQDALYLAQLRYFTVFAAIGEHILAFITGELFLVLAARAKHLARATFIPSTGHGNTSAVAFCMGMKESGARDLAIRRNLPVVKPGEERIYQFSDITKTFAKEEKQPNSVAPVKPKRIRRKKTP